MYSGNQASYDNLSENMKQKLEGLKTPIVNDLTTGGSDKALSAESGKELKSLVDEKADGEDLKSLQTEVTEHLAEMDTELGKTLKVNTFNNTNKKSNLGVVNASVAFDTIQFNNSDVSEVLEIHLPYPYALNGSIELNVTSQYANSNASGTAKVIYNTCLTSEGLIISNSMEILNMPKEFADNFYISSIQKSDKSKAYIISIIKRKYSNNITIDLTVRNTGAIPSAEIVNSIAIAKPYKLNAIVNTTDYPIQQPIFKFSLPAPANAVLSTGWSVRPNYYLKYYKDAFGIVRLYGRVDRNGGGTLITTLPVGYRPIENFETGVTQGVTGHTYIEIFQDGRVIAPVGVADNTNILIECSFRTT